MTDPVFNPLFIFQFEFPYISKFVTVLSAGAVDKYRLLFAVLHCHLLAVECVCQSCRVDVNGPDLYLM